ncbi:MAG: YkgJ family cysteine cluster protein [Candidatus Diapherotrites archaeon]|nr:YkgJ family cysteine cluster protein [Candidatus Diapherotrites archaeon]
MDFNCTKCGECCKRYFIQILPEDAEKISKFMGIPLEEFISDYTQLFLQFFIGDFKSTGLVIPSAFIPKKFIESINSIVLGTPKELMVLPTIAFKRNDKTCVFLNNLNNCKIYPVRPHQCRIFPFISMNKLESDFLDLYPFCKGLESSDLKKNKNLAEPHFKKTNEYFSKIKKKGFSSQWKTLPKKGLAVLETKILSEINRKEFSEITDLLK